MIKGTYSDCKIQSIVISNSTAILHCIIYSSVPAETQKAFKFYIRDKKDPLNIQEVSQNIYWIDRLNNYNNDSINIDVNQYLAFTLSIDITDKNRSEIIDNKWVRTCNLILKELNNKENEYNWISPDLTLISKEFEIPELRNLDIRSDKDFKLTISYSLFYNSQQDFSYNDKNLYVTINTLSLYTDNILETKNIYTENIKNGLTSVTFDKTYDSPIKIQMLLRNPNNTVLDSFEKYYKPIQRRTSTYVKTSEGIKKVLGIFVKNDGVSYINFNNLAIKLPKLKSIIIDRVGDDTIRFINPNFIDFTFSKVTITIDDKDTITTSEVVYKYPILKEDMNKPHTFKIELIGLFNKYYQTDTYTRTIKIFNLVCSENLSCSEDLLCSA